MSLTSSAPTPVSAAFAQMCRELGKRHSPGFGVLLEFTRGQLEWCLTDLRELANMLENRCFAHSQSGRRYRSRQLWQVLKLNKSLLKDLADLCLEDQYYHTALRHVLDAPAASPALCNHVLDSTTDERIIEHVLGAARRRRCWAVVKRCVALLEAMPARWNHVLDSTTERRVIELVLDAARGRRCWAVVKRCVAALEAMQPARGTDDTQHVNRN